MPILSDNALNEAMGAIVINQLSLHSAFDPAGGNELINSPYVRQPVTSFAAVSGLLIATGTDEDPAIASFSVAANDTVAFVGLWDATDPMNPVFQGMLPASGQGVFLFILSDDLTTVICPNNFFLFDTAAVISWNAPGVVLNPLTEGTIYYVVNSTINTLQLTDAVGNDPLTFAQVGIGYLQIINPVTFNSISTYSIGTITIDPQIVSAT